MRIERVVGQAVGQLADCVLNCGILANNLSIFNHSVLNQLVIRQFTLSKSLSVLFRSGMAQWNCGIEYRCFLEQKT